MPRRFIPPEARSQVWSLFDSETQRALTDEYTGRINDLVLGLGRLVEQLGGKVESLEVMDNLLVGRPMVELEIISKRLAELAGVLFQGQQPEVTISIPVRSHVEQEVPRQPIDKKEDISPAVVPATPAASGSRSFPELSAESNTGKALIRIRFLERIYPTQEAAEAIEQLSDQARAQLIMKLLDIYEQRVGGHKLNERSMRRLRLWAEGLRSDREVVIEADGDVLKAPVLVRNRSGIVSALTTQVNRETLDRMLRVAIASDAQEGSAAAPARPNEEKNESAPAKVVTPEDRLPALHREFLQYIYEGDETLCGLIADMDDSLAARLIRRLIKLYDETITNKRVRAKPEQLARLSAWADGMPDRRIAERAGISQTNIISGRMGIADQLRKSVYLEVLERVMDEVIDEGEGAGAESEAVLLGAGVSDDVNGLEDDEPKGGRREDEGGGDSGQAEDKLDDGTQSEGSEKTEAGEVNEFDELVKRFAWQVELSDDQLAALMERLDPEATPSGLSMASEVHSELLNIVKERWRQTRVGQLTPLQQEVMNRFVGIRMAQGQMPQLLRMIASVLSPKLKKHNTDIRREFAAVFEVMTAHGDRASTE